MFTVALALAGLAALLHVYIWVLESIRWEAPATRRTFGTSEDGARVTKPLAFNQGFYNLFLAIVTGAGIVAAGSDRAVAVALLIAGVGSMFVPPWCSWPATAPAPALPPCRARSRCWPSSRSRCRRCRTGQHGASAEAL